MDHIVVDVEIQKTIDETPGGWDATDKLGVSCACVWEYADQRMRIYGPDDVEALRKRLLSADRISGFNIFNFDFPVIWEISRPDWASKRMAVLEIKDALRPKTNDILRRIWWSLGLDPDNFNPRTHGGFSLDQVMSNLFNVRKIGNGADAPKWFQAGQWAKVANYCADDVALERDLADFVDSYGFIIHPKTGQQITINARPGR